MSKITEIVIRAHFTINSISYVTRPVKARFCCRRRPPPSPLIHSRSQARSWIIAASRCFQKRFASSPLMLAPLDSAPPSGRGGVRNWQKSRAFAVSLHVFNNGVAGISAYSGNNGRGREFGKVPRQGLLWILMNSTGAPGARWRFRWRKSNDRPAAPCRR